MGLSSLVRKSLLSLKMEWPKVAASATSIATLSPSFPLLQSSSSASSFASGTLRPPSQTYPKSPFTTSAPAFSWSSSINNNNNGDSASELHAPAYPKPKPYIAKRRGSYMNGVQRMYLMYANDCYEHLNEKLRISNAMLEGPGFYHFMGFIFSLDPRGNCARLVWLSVDDYLVEYAVCKESIREAKNLGYIDEDCWMALRGDYSPYFEDLLSVEGDWEYLTELVDNCKEFMDNMGRLAHNYSRLVRIF